MGFKDLTKILLIGGLIFLTCTKIVQAGFGVSPPKVLNHHLLPGSHFEQTIYLVQSKPNKDLIATLEIDAPEIRNWITIERGLEFTIPAGTQLFPVKVNIEVPRKAEFKSYKGKIWIKTREDVPEKEGTVSLALGALIYVDLRVSAEEVHGFIFRGLEIPKLEQGWPIKVEATLQNTGNTKDGPSRIHLDVYDQYHAKVLQSSDATKLGYIKPFKSEKVVAKFPTKLGLGMYWAEVTIYKDEDIIMEDKRIFYIVEKGSLSKGWGWLVWTLIGIAILVGLFFLNRWWKRKHGQGIFAKVIYKFKSLKMAWRKRKKRKLEKKLKKISKE